MKERKRICISIFIVFCFALGALLSYFICSSLKDFLIQYYVTIISGFITIFALKSTFIHEDKNRADDKTPLFSCTVNPQIVGDKILTFYKNGIRNSDNEVIRPDLCVLQNSHKNSFTLTKITINDVEYKCESNFLIKEGENILIKIDDISLTQSKKKVRFFFLNELKNEDSIEYDI